MSSNDTYFSYLNKIALTTIGIMMFTTFSIKDCIADINEGHEPKNIPMEEKAELAISDLTFPPTREGALLWLIENNNIVRNNKKLRSKALEYLSEISESHLEKKESEKQLVLELKNKIK